MDPKIHWEAIYTTKWPSEMSWYQPFPTRSIELLLSAGAGRDSAIIDVGGGDSRLVDALLEREFRDVTVLDISAKAIERARARLGARADAVKWIEADVRNAELAAHGYDVWHDRAVFHFLTQPDERAAYVTQVCRALRPAGTLIIATFALQGPTRCSGLEVARYDASGLARELGEEFVLQDSLTDVHRTPSGVEQVFTYAVFQRR
ncbi:MAG TPA: class I SAM-dependent methyltransferase [Gemmatimonadaceae bacterium]|jgi:SAM-dependent methyltransferase|nr:class I SAM-dependent methyltransferase [Gemmatimonadaceae bacterium]